ncbi:YbhB/YbcL family Raf kinase inhibitor-like protein [Streptococcus suis]|nr:YbhB/YbcL family Raf kinase inhibitor-like protein [Streptococcus suis]
MIKKYLNYLPDVKTFTVTSNDITDGKPFRLDQLSVRTGIEGAKDISPQLSWSDIPEGTRSFAVTMYDIDAPTGSGFWHWAVKDIPANITSLEAGAGNPDSSQLPKEAIQIPNDARVAGYAGAAPMPGTGVHNYIIMVHALDVEKIDIPSDATPAFLGMMISQHALGRAVLVATASAD